MSVDFWEVARWCVFGVVVGGLLLYLRKQTSGAQQPARVEAGQDMRRTIEDLTATVNTLGRQLEEATRRIRTLEAENSQLQTRVAELESQVKPAPLPLPAAPLEVIVGGDLEFFEGSRVALRRAGVPFRRILDATQELVRAEIRRRRQDCSVSPWMLIVAHAGPPGVQLKDGIAGPEFWHEVLDGVNVVVLSSCSASTTADELAGLVDTVIWFHESVLKRDAYDFMYALFRRLMQGMNVNQAFLEATREVPAVCEFVDLRHS